MMRILLKIARITVIVAFALYASLWVRAQLSFSHDFHGYPGAEANEIPATREDCQLMADAMAHAQWQIALPGAGCRKVVLGGKTIYGSVAIPSMNQTRVPSWAGGTIISPYVELPKYSKDRRRAVVSYGSTEGSGEDGFGKDCEYRKFLGFWYSVGCKQTWVS